MLALTFLHVSLLSPASLVPLFSQLTIRHVTPSCFSSVCLHFSLLLYLDPLSVHTAFLNPLFSPLFIGFHLSLPRLS